MRLSPRKFEAYLHERENAKKPRAVRLSRPQLPTINCSAADSTAQPNAVCTAAASARDRFEAEICGTRAHRCDHDKDRDHCGCNE